MRLIERKREPEREHVRENVCVCSCLSVFKYTCE